MSNTTVNLFIKNGLVKQTNNGYSVKCPSCLEFRLLKTRETARRACKNNRICGVCSTKKSGLNKIGKNLSDACRISMSMSKKNKYSDINERKKLSILIKNAMNKPDIRKNHIEALYRSKWLKVKTDNGQLELLKKWNGLGFNFEPNFQIKTNKNLFYVDGYDSKNGVVMEYDTQYHKKLSQKNKDLIRQQEIINILNPKKFWRYDNVDKQFNCVYQSNNIKQTTI